MSSEETKVAAAETKPAAPQPVQPTAATLSELKSAIPDSDAVFREKCLEQGYSLPQAQTAWMGVLRDQVKAKDAELATVKAKAAMPGSDGVTTGKVSTVGGSAIDQWDKAVAEKTAAGVSKQRALSMVAKENPDLHARYVSEWNTARGRSALQTA